MDALEEALRLYQETNMSVDEICKTRKMAKSTLDRVYKNSTEGTRLDRKYEIYMALASCRSDSQDKLCELLEIP